MVSVDTPEENKAFAEQEQADFPMLSDPEKTVADAYGVLPPVNPDRPDAARVRAPLDVLHRAGRQDSCTSRRWAHTADAGEFLATKLEELGVKKEVARSRRTK